jgi:hypothetical protein
MSNSEKFLAAKAAVNDTVLLHVLEETKPQQLRAKILAILTARKGITQKMLDREIEFVHASSAWGNKPLRPGQTALVFLSEISGRLYEDSWNGHLLVDDIEGEQYASYRFPELWLSENLPASLRAFTRADPQRPQCSAIRLPELADYITKELG